MDQRREFYRGKSFETNQERNSPLQYQRFSHNNLKDGPFNNERQSNNQNITNQYNPLRNQQDQSQINKQAFLNRQFPSLKDQQQRQSEESLQIDQRHEELKKQIAQKEKLLAEMTNERQNNLRLKGQRHLLQGESMSSLFQNSNIGNDHSMDEIRKFNMPQNRSRLAAREVLDSRQSSLPQNINFKPSSSQTRTQNPQQLQNPSPLQRSRDYQNENYSRSRSGEGARWNQAYADESEQNYSFRAGAELPPRNTFSDSPLRNRSTPQQELRISGLNPIPRYTQPTLTQQPSILKREIGGYNDVSQLTKREQNQPLVQRREIGGYTGEISNARDSLFKQRIEMLTMDNASLQNRLNNVSEDLQRIQAEREQLKQEMQLFENSNNVITRQLNQKDEVDMENIVLKQDCDKKRIDNQALDAKLKQEQQQLDETNIRLTSTNQIQQNLTFDVNNLNSDYDKKVQIIDDYRKKRDQAKHEIMMVNENLAQFNEQEHQFNHDNIHLNTLIEQLSTERQRLVVQLQDMTRSFDECIEDTSKMQNQLTKKQKWHSQILAGRVIEQTLKSFQNKLSSSCFIELKNYSAFDKNCQDKLIKLSNVLYKLGLQIQKEGLNKWYCLSLKPLSLRKQNEDFGVMIQCDRLQSKVFYALKNFQTIKHTEYLHKSDAVERAKSLLDRSRKIELKRAISLWKEKLRFDKLKQKVLLKLCSYSKTGQLWQALTRWKEFSVQLEQAVRLHFLKQDFSQRTFIQRIFGQIRAVTQYEKNQRQKTLRLCLKSWKDFKQKKAYLLRQNMTTLQFLHSNKQMTLINCFNALKQHKQQKKQKLVQQAIKKDLDVGIRQFEQSTEEIKKQVQNRNVNKACYIVRDMTQKKIFSYWSKWHKETTWKKATLNRKHKDRIVRLYLTRLRTAFGLWQIGLNFKASQEEQGGNQDILMENEQLQNENLNLQGDLEFCEVQDQKAKRTTLDKICRRLKNKTERLALNMWLDEVKRKQIQSKRLYKIMMKWMRGKQAEALGLYKEWMKQTVQDEKNQLRQNNFIANCNFKTKTSCFNAIYYITQRKQKAKKTLKKIVNKFERSIKLQLMTMWLQGANIMTQEQLAQRQVEITQMLEEENQLLSTIERKKQEQVLSIGDTGETRQNQAYRQIGIYMVRHYEQSIKGAFSTWKDRTRDLKHKHMLIITHINQMKRAAFSDFRRRCRKFANIARQQEKLETIKVKQIEQKTLIQASKHGKENQNKKVEETKGIIEKNEQEISILKVERDKTIQFLERRSQNLNFMSRKRMIFLSWRNVTKQQTSALKLIQKFIKKDVLLKAYQEIKHYSVNKNINEKISKTLNIYILKKYKRTLSDAMSAWKNFSLKFTDSKQNNITEQTEQIVQSFSEHVDQIKEVNTQRCFNVFIKKNYSNLWNGWVNVTKNLKKLRQARQTFLSNQKNLQKQLVVQFWYRRIQATNRARQMELIVANHNAKKLQKNCFRAMKQKLKNFKSLNYKLGGLECLLKTKVTQDTFKTLRSFVISKDLAKGNQKYIATYDLMRYMRQAHIKNLRAAFYAYREKTAGYKTYKENPKLKQIFNKFSSCNLRAAFEKWRNIDSKISLLQEQYDSGPVRADDWEAGREIHNLVEFMKDEKFSDDEINQFYKNNVKNRNENIMTKYIIQMKMKGREDGVIVYCLDRWKKFTRMRKLVAHTLRLCENRTQEVKADLSYAFNKWKNDHQNMDTALCRQSYQTLKEIGVKTSFQVNKAADELAENNSIANHLQLQRDEFLNFFIKSQRLGLAFFKDKCLYSEFQAWSRWFYQLSKSQQEQLEREMRDASYLHSNLDQRSAFLKLKNGELETENNDLTNFKNDKEVIKKNLASIQEDRNELRERLDQHEEYYEALLEENENLKRLIAEAEQHKSQQGPNVKFLNMQSLKENNEKKENQSQGGQRSAQKQPETEDQRKTRERFEKLQQLQASAGIR